MKALKLLIILLLIATPCYATISLTDQATNGSDAKDNPRTLDITVTSGTDIVVLIIHGSDDVERVTDDPTFDGLGMTECPEGAALGLAEAATEIWYRYLDGTVSGTKTISVDNDGTELLNLTAVTFTSDSTGVIFDDSTSWTTNSATPCNLTSLTVGDGDAVIAGLSHGYNSNGSSASHTELYNVDEGIWWSASQYTIKSGAGSISMTWSSSSDDTAFIMCSFTEGTPPSGYSGQVVQKRREWYEKVFDYLNSSIVFRMLFGLQ